MKQYQQNYEKSALTISQSITIKFKFHQKFISIGHILCYQTLISLISYAPKTKLANYS